MKNYLPLCCMIVLAGCSLNPPATTHQAAPPEEQTGDVFLRQPEGEIIADLSQEPVPFEVPAGMTVMKDVQDIQTEIASLADLCELDAGSRDALLATWTEGDASIYPLLDENEAATYVVIVLPNVPGYADRLEVATAFNECRHLSLLALTERWLVFGVQSGLTPSAMDAEKTVTESMRLR